LENASCSSLLQTVRAEENFAVDRAADDFAVDLLLLLVLALVAVLLREVDAGRGGLSGKENTGDAAAVGVLFD